ncbi:hypothetical protein M407DRAFT_209775 [Tulasnella calospora MUT 4182]|uniref:COP9 signalosome complex subunit 6 n=1 Tax=Tulasnella calospora MUT 4182 TaxID=1051891 RepID=A0A0C3QN40_9AGAM|nr:hypothetical protein M407DRAFT_209775 [Tulasnella calospora MUT 4182]
METDEAPTVLPSTTKSSLSISLHPVPILNISGHLTRLRLQTRKYAPFAFGALLGTQNGREVEIVNSFELISSGAMPKVDHGFLAARKEQYKQVFPSLDFIGWYSVAVAPTPMHIAIHEQLIGYHPTPLLLVLQPTSTDLQKDSGVLPFKAYEPTVEIRDRKSRNVYIEAPYKIETGEAERIAVDSTAKGGAESGTLSSHLQTQRAAIKMLHDRILALVEYVSNCVAGTAQKDHEILRALAALVASLPASENKYFRSEFEDEQSDVLLTTYLSTLTKSQNILNDIVDKYVTMTDMGREHGGHGGGLRSGKRRGEFIGARGMRIMEDWAR